ncbi:hypothetical protein BDV96DRAFT_604439 [Lophiotrema nucula]|uniref:Uncharacterized protein n=1 Tax=Lophiotrema nucula TaxID=690887 RepID=A0A6A5YSK6_9PLEO|nr:hypothetical protein BDV96DRAFT_604439 [Lophiotrema nucula]
MSEVDAKFVHRGLWTNLEKGPILGKTITTNLSTGTLVIALLAILSSLATAHVWHLAAFAYHQIRANGAPADGLFRQQQALLRTLPTPSSYLTDSLKLWWYWKGRADSVSLRCTLQPLIALFFTIATLAASISSSFVVDTTNLEVLVDSPFCAPVSPPRGSPFSTVLTYMTAVTDVAQPYVNECYDNNGTSFPALCSAFTRPDIPLVNEAVACPFNASMCVGGGSTPAAQIDSGLVDFNSGFGLNLPKDQRIKLRRKTACGILPLDGHTKVYSAEDDVFKIRPPLPGEQMIEFNYGNETDGSQFIFSLSESNVTRTYGIDGNYNFNPIPSEMGRDDAFLALLLVQKNAITYKVPVNDPMFAAHVPFTRNNSAGTGEMITEYYSDFPYSVVGCAQQFQFCHARKSSSEFCTDLMSLPESINATFPEASALQRVLFKNIVMAFSMLEISRTHALKAAQLVQPGGLVPSLPDDQWRAEILYWESFVWAALQHQIADYAIGPAVRDTTGGASKYVGNVTTEAQKQLCKVQKMRKAGGFMNINVFGLVLITVVALLAAVIDITLLRFLIFLSRFRKALAPRIDRWIQDGVLQLQRRAYEATGQGTWTNLDADVPVTVEKSVFEELPKEFEPKRTKTGYSFESQDTVMIREVMDGKAWGVGDSNERLMELWRSRTFVNDVPDLRSKR